MSVSADVWVADDTPVEARNAGPDNRWISIGEYPAEATIFLSDVEGAKRLRDALDKTIEAMEEARRDEDISSATEEVLQQQ